MPRYYIPYRGPLTDADDLQASRPLREVLRRHFHYVRTAHQYGWRNQPRVYTFQSNREPRIINAILESHGLHPWLPTATLKDWR